MSVSKNAFLGSILYRDGEAFRLSQFFLIRIEGQEFAGTNHQGSSHMQYVKSTMSSRAGVG